MIVVLGYIVFGVYVICLCVIAIYCIIQFHLLFHYLRKNAPHSPIEVASDDLPMVTIQLPIFNEYFVVERLIENIIEIEYPKDKIEIQVLDDSTDDTVLLSRKLVDKYKALGFDIKLIQREDRKGYKAGALKQAMHTARGEFIAIFDADFLPKPDFLKKTIPLFQDEKVAVVQTRWGHLNQGHSLLTEVQAFQLNVHFTVEQKGRQLGNYLLQFNGTAGVWRAEAIEDAGGWEADTLTEDLDLSYRAQLKGWKIKYMEETVSPAELPAEMMGLKSQQHRWMKGGAETAKKLLPKVWGSELSLIEKVHGSIHLLGSSVFLSIFMVGVFSVPLMFVVLPTGLDPSMLKVFVISTIIIAIIYFVSNVRTAWEGRFFKLLFKSVVLLPIFLSLSMGFSFHNSIAVIQGYLGKKTPFVRTPKFDIKGISSKLRDKKYHKYSLSKIVLMEGFLSLYFLAAVLMGISIGNFSLMPLHIMLFFGYGGIFFYSVKHFSPKG